MVITPIISSNRYFIKSRPMDMFRSLMSHLRHLIQSMTLFINTMFDSFSHYSFLLINLLITITTSNNTTVFLISFWRFWIHSIFINIIQIMDIILMRMFSSMFNLLYMFFMINMFFYKMMIITLLYPLFYFIIFN